MSILFTGVYPAQGADMDFNPHRANSAFLDYVGRFKLRNQFATETDGQLVAAPRRRTPGSADVR